MVTLNISKGLAPVLKSSWSQTLAAYGTTQAVLAAGAFARIPLLVAAVAATGYGSIVAFSGLCVVVIAVADGLAQTTRAMTAERHAPNFGRYNRIQNVATSLSVVTVLSLLGGAAIALAISPSPDNLWAAALFCLGMSATALFGGPAKGLLEATGKTAQVHLLQTTTTLIGLPLLFATMYLSPSLVTASAVTGFGLAIPYLSYLVAARGTLKRSKISVRRALYSLPRMRSVPEWKSVMSMTTWTWANSLNYAFDASIVGLVAGAAAAGEFGLASRVMTLAMLLSLALNPLITARVSSWRTSFGYHALLRRVGRLSLWIGLTSVALSTLSVALGPWLAGVLSHNQISSPLPLYVALAVFATTSAITAPLMGLFAGSGGASFRAKFSAIMALVNVCLSVIATIYIGNSGPVISSTITLVALSVILLIRMRNEPQKIMERY